MLLFLWGCGASRSTSTATNDTYLTAKDRARLNQQAQQNNASGDIDARADNYEGADRSSRRWNREDDDYCYSCRIRRYSTGVWYDPWFDPWWGPGWRSAWWGPGWGPAWAWGPSWGWGMGWTVMPGWYYTPGWGWSYYAGYWGPVYYAGPVWYDRGWTAAPSRSPNYMPRTYTAPRGTTIYTAPRSSSVGGTATPPRRTAAPATRPTSTPAVRPSSVPVSPRPSTPSGATGGGIRTSTGTARPR